MQLFELSRSPNKPVIPANNPKVLFPSQPSESAGANDATPKNQIEYSDPTTKSTTINPPVELPNQTQLKATDVLSSIKQSARKAIDNQQWLRAQHHLEHALRVAPKDAEVFYLYALVYEGLGVKEQLLNMLKRAKFLAKPNSEIYKLAELKLQKHAP